MVPSVNVPIEPESAVRSAVRLVFRPIIDRIDPSSLMLAMSTILLLPPLPVIVRALLEAEVPVVVIVTASGDPTTFLAVACR